MSRKSPGRNQEEPADGPAGTSSPGMPKTKSRGREWLDAVVFALLAALIIRAFFFEAFRIPTPSMERNLRVGDFLLVSKLHYGPRLPVTLGIPFTDIYWSGLELPYLRLPGLRSVERGDAVVFNWPPERGPVDRKTHYIKRAVGLPGDTLQVIDKVVYVNGEPLPLGEGMQQHWIVQKSGPRVELPGAVLREHGITESWRVEGRGDQVRINATPSARAAIEELPYVERVEPATLPPTARGMPVFPPGSGFNRDQYGPIVVPRRGMTVALNDTTWSLYERAITRFEGHAARRRADGTFFIDGERAETYTFEQDYYFMMGDNRDDSQDSRAWGFVPADHLVGKAFLIYFSWDKERNVPRPGRIFDRIP